MCLLSQSFPPLLLALAYRLFLSGERLASLFHRALNALLRFRFHRGGGDALLDGVVMFEDADHDVARPPLIPERAANKLVIRLFTARAGIIIGRKGAEIDKLKGEIQKRTKREVHIDIQEVHRPELDAQLVAESIALQLEKRVAFRRAMRKAVDSALRFGCKGIKVRVAGRLNGAEIARKEWYLQGRLPLQTLRADIDFGFAEAHTSYGVIGVKCWVYQGENVPERGQKKVVALAAAD